MSTIKDWMKEDNLKVFEESRVKAERLREHVEAMHEAVVPKQHHIWCNYWSRPVETCKQCKGLYKNYPMGDLTPDELRLKHFPNVTKRT